MRWHRPIGRSPLAVGCMLVVSAVAAGPARAADPAWALRAPADSIVDSIPLSDDTVDHVGDTLVVAPDTARVPVATGTNGEPAPVETCPLGPHRRVAQGAAAGVFVGANLELFRRFKAAWWSGEKADRFFFRADWDEAFRDQDKFGHMWGGYHLTRLGSDLLRATCVPERKAVVLSALYATLFQLQIEIWDGYYEKYGFSYPDLLANTMGMGLAVLHAVRPETQIVKPTISYRRTAAMRQQEAWDEIRHSIDYSGQTYWLSLDVDQALPENARRYWPGILRLSAGHSITDWILPREPGAPAGTPQQAVRAKRRLLLSLDIDAGKLPGDHPVWNFFKRQLSYIRLPAPALQITPDLEFIRWYR